MKKVILSLLSWSLPFTLLAQMDNSQGIKWAEGLTWEQVKEKAKEESKYIFVDAYATWCGPCKKMDQNVYTDNSVGEVVNKDFISVKVQMDTTATDNDKVKSWYPVVKYLNQYKISGYPSFLFFTPQGELAYKTVGYRDVNGFITLAKMALTDPNKKFAVDVEKFKNDKFPFTQMPELARQAWYDKKDKALAISIAKKYKTGYADKLNDKEAFSKENLSFLAEFYSDIELSSQDRYFRFFYNHKASADSIINKINDRAQGQVVANVIKGVVRREEITQKLYLNGKPIINVKPDWAEIKNSIRAKYGSALIDEFFPDEQINFYSKAKDWNNYAKFVSEKMKRYPPQKDGKLFGRQFGDAWQLNAYAWAIFLGCNDKQPLKKALVWIDLSIELGGGDGAIDTKANLIYKLGRVKEAINLEQNGIKNLSEDNIEVINKMKAGLPTWPL